MIAVDTNILVYAHREDSLWHAQASERLTALANSGAPWAIAWPSIHEFLAIVTHPKIYNPPTPLAAALEAIRAWQHSPGLRLLGEGPGYFETLENRQLREKSKARKSTMRASPRFAFTTASNDCGQRIATSHRFRTWFAKIR